MLTFNPDTHEYRWKDRIVPSVTQIIGEWIRVKGADYYLNVFDGNIIPATRFEQAGDFGRAIHKACGLIITKTLDWNSLDPSLIPALQQFKIWLEDFSVEIIHTEKIIYSEKDDLAGTADIICKIKKVMSIVEIKTPKINRMVGVQTSGYERLFRASEKYRGIIKRYELILPKNGSQYKFTPLTNNQDISFLLGKNFEWRYLYGNGYSSKL